jgi:hypothetical protein
MSTVQFLSRETTQLASILWLRQLYDPELYHDYFEVSEVEDAVSCWW